MDLNTIWFLAIAAFFTIYFVLEGFDFGVGMSLPLLGGKSAKEADARRSAAVESIGPLWDGNEAWLIVAGGVAYITGAVCYALQAPTIHREWFGFHELFHAFTVAGFVCHAVAIYRAVLVVA